MNTPRLYADLAELWPLVSPPEEYAGEAAFYRQCFAELGVPDGAALLHLGSGGGSLDWQLKAHYRLTGVDRSAPMVTHARQVNPEVEYLVGDMCDVRLGRLFDAVLIHDAIGYLQTPAELAAVYATAAAHLAPGGALVSVTEHLRERFEQHRVTWDTHTDGQRAVTTIQVDYDRDPTDWQFETTFLYLIHEGDTTRVEFDPHVSGLRTLDDLIAAAQAAGFSTQTRLLPAEEVPDEPPYPVILGRRL